MTDHNRYFALDAIRAAMMFLGIVIHSAINYSSSEDMTWPLRAKETSGVFFFLVDFLHAFRMPIFFLIAGFFGAFLFLNKSPEQMLLNRFKRIFLPFLVFLILLRPLLSYAFKYCSAVFEGEVPITFIAHFSSLGSYIPYHLSHLWFLYYLFIISVMAYGVAKWTKFLSVSFINSITESIITSPLYRVLVLAFVSFVILYLSGAESFETSVSWVPNVGILMFFISFYAAGWILYRQKAHLHTLNRYDLLITCIGIFLFCAKFFYFGHIALLGLQFFNAMITTTLSIGIMGLFLRFADFSDKRITYLVQSAYWVYLIHFGIALWLSGMLNRVEISVYFKFLIVLTVTTAICLTTYHFFVRNTFIGLFLNGKKAQ